MDRQSSPNDRLFRLRSPQLVDAGFSGGAVYSDELSAVVAIQIEAGRARFGAISETVLAMPLYRIAQLSSEISKLLGVKYRTEINEAGIKSQIIISNTCYFHVNNGKYNQAVFSDLGRLSWLRKLDLSDQQLRQLPLEVTQLINLTSLNLSKNQLRTLPVDIRQLVNLTTLDVSNNQLRILPAEIVELESLTTLDISNNPLRRLPLEVTQLANLSTLNLSGNILRALPAEIRPLRYLTELDLRGNPLPIPPEILERTSEPGTILDYYFREHKIALNEAKLILVGQGRVGKTSLVKRLVENEFDEDERVTEGIAIRDWKVTTDDEEIKLNIWDFGGQEIMHATHQFFLTTRSLYLLVLDVQNDEPNNKLNYWLKLIQNYGKDSPIIIVNNKFEFGQLFLNQNDLQRKYPAIKAFVNTSCKMGWGLSELEQRITIFIHKLKHVRDEIPFKWLKIKEELESITKDYISYQEYVELCLDHDVKEEQEQKNLIRLLHDLGIVINFQNNPKLRDTSVLNPEWVTRGVYQIINAKQPLQNQGILEIEQLDHILDHQTYPKNKHLFIIDIMREFELCFDLEGYTEERFLVPDLLPEQEPEREWPLDEDSLNFEYHYEFLPSSIISRLMVRLRHFIFQDVYWRHGMILVNNRNKALVKALPEENKIFVFIIGESQGRQVLRTIIDTELKRIHAQIKGLHIQAEITELELVSQTSQRHLLRKLQIRGIHKHFTSANHAKLEEIADLKKTLEPLRLTVHPQHYYPVTFSLGKLYYSELGEYTRSRYAFVQADEALQMLRSLILEEEQQKRLSWESAHLYEMLVDCCIVEGDENKAFKYTAVSKGRAFINKLAKSRLDFSQIGKNKSPFMVKLAKVRKIRSRIEYLERHSTLDKGERRGEQDVLLRQEKKLWEEMANEYPLLTATLSVPILSVKQARELAKELDATLVEYYRHGAQGSSGWCAFVVTGERIRYVRLPQLDDDLLEELAEWRNNVHLSTGRSPRRLKRLASLYSAAVAPLRLASKRVIMAPFRELHLLPLSATYYVNRSGEKCYLAETHTLSYVPSLTALYVVYQEQKRRPSSQGFERLLSVAYPGTPPLPNVLEEAKAIAECLAGIAAVEPFHGKDATPDKVLSRLKDAPNFDVIHFGCHGRFDSRQPTASGLMLAEKPLTIEQIITKLNLKETRLATLAACLTGEVALRDGEEHIGLLQAMMTAGVQTVVASLWAVDDAATRALFEAFYSREAMLNAPAQAMREASKLLRDTAAWAHPFYWAGFAVNGLVQPTVPSAERWPPADLHAKMAVYAQQSTRHRSEIMTNEKIIEDAELLLKDLLDDCEEVWQALQPPYTLSQQVAQQQVVAGQLGLAKALRLIVRDNPALHEFTSEDGATFRIDPKQHDERHQSTPSSENSGQVWNEVSDIFQEFTAVMQQEYHSSAKKKHNKRGILKRVFGRFLPHKGDSL